MLVFDKKLWNEYSTTSHSITKSAELSFTRATSKVREVTRQYSKSTKFSVRYQQRRLKFGLLQYTICKQQYIAQQNNPPSGTNGGGSNLGNYSKLSVDTNTGSTKNPPSDTNGGGSNLDWYCNPISTQWFSSVQ